MSNRKDWTQCILIITLAKIKLNVLMLSLLAISNNYHQHAARGNLNQRLCR